jgi:hypothetical protein
VTDALIRLTRRGTEVVSDPAGLTRLRAAFERDHCVRLPGLLDPDLVRQLLPRIEKGPFEDFLHEYDEGDARVRIKKEVCLQDAATVCLLNLLPNDRPFFEIVEAITGCGHIGCFHGRVYRMLPASDHHDSWHSDAADHRIVSMSVNLTPEPFRGGELQIRDVATGRVVHEVANRGLGDAILFRIAPELDHRVADVEGAIPKTAFAGWFESEPDFDTWVRDRAKR